MADHEVDGVEETATTNDANNAVVSDAENAQQQKPTKKAAKHDSGAADLEKVTDYAEEKEIASSDLHEAITWIGNKRCNESAEKAAREKELAKVLIRKEDLELIMKEMEIPRSVAELKLREHSGNVVDALIELTD